MTVLRLMALRLLRATYRTVAASPFGVLLRQPAVERVRLRSITVRASDVLEVLEALKAAGVEAWLAGGWGSDALVGAQTRKHGDLDLVCSLSDEAPGRAAIEAAGFRFDYRQIVPGVGMPIRVVMRDGAGRTVDMHPVDLDAPPFAPGSDGAAAEPFAVGTVGGQPVGCLSAALQIVLRQGYAARESDRRDVARLCGHFGLAAPTAQD